MRLKGGYRKRMDAVAALQETARNIGETVALMDPTPQAETLVCTLVRLIEQSQLHVRVYTKGHLHAKAYVLNYGPVCEEPLLPSE